MKLSFFSCRMMKPLWIFPRYCSYVLHLQAGFSTAERRWLLLQEMDESWEQIVICSHRVRTVIKPVGRGTHSVREGKRWSGQRRRYEVVMLGCDYGVCVVVDGTFSYKRLKSKQKDIRNEAARIRLLALFALWWTVKILWGDYPPVTGTPSQTLYNTDNIIGYLLWILAVPSKRKGKKTLFSCHSPAPTTTNYRLLM